MECIENFVEPRTFGQRSGAALADIEVITSGSGGTEILDLPVSVLRFG